MFIQNSHTYINQIDIKQLKISISLHIKAIKNKNIFKKEKVDEIRIPN